MRISHITKVGALTLIVGGTLQLGLSSELQGEEQASSKIELRNDLLEILDTEQLQSALPGVHVRHSETGEELFSYNSDISLAPASGQKLLVGATALDVLGPEFTFETGIYTDGYTRGSILHGNIYLKGGGDPTLLASDFDQLAKELHNQGIRMVQGDIIADDTYFDDTRLSLDLSWANQRGQVGAQVSALSFAPDAALISDVALDRYNTASVYVEVHPGKEPGDEAEIKVTPESEYYSIDNKMITVEEDGDRELAGWGRDHGTNDIFFEGTIPVGDNSFNQYVSIWEPTNLAADLFATGLKDARVRVNGEVVLGETPEDAEALFIHESMTLEELMIPYMKFSQNSHSEHLTKALGQKVHGEGSWDKGLDVVEEYLDSAGVNTNVVQLRDGSGMSHLNAIPTEEMTQFLLHAQDEEWFDIFYGSLPVAAESDHYVGGTLRTRMADTAAASNVAAKTGSLTSKSSLSGYVTDADGEEWIFSIIMNNYIGSSPTAVENDIAIRLAEYETD
ncbi:hypothetical protein DH09_09040 [Bacillaceae bacterium JMAK1]|nr:hypothetical protein DH09_09040 [Bacillaceae bacterium JMAK1]